MGVVSKLPLTACISATPGQLKRLIRNQWQWDGEEWVLCFDLPLAKGLQWSSNAS